MEVVCTAVLVLLSVQICFCQPAYPLPAAPSSVAVNIDNGEVFVAAGSQLLRLNNSLHLLENVTVGGGGELVVIALSPDGSRLVGCLGGDSRTCLVYDSQNLTSGETAKVNNAHYNPENGLAIITTDESFYLGSEGAIQGAPEYRHNIFLAQYNYTSATVRTTRDRSLTFFSNALLPFIRHFYGGFSRNGYVYYFVSDIPANIRVLRVCDCAQETCSSEFDALIELLVYCGGVSDTTRVCGVDILDDHLVIVTLCDDGTVSSIRRNSFCFFLLSDIDDLMDKLYTTCRDSDTLVFKLVWKQSRSSCSQFNPISPCNFSGTPAITYGGQSTPIYAIGFRERVITASLVISIDNVTLLYVATSESINVFGLSITQNSTGLSSQGNYTIVSVESSVKDISWEEGSDYITVTTNSEIFLYPLETCFNVSTCDECTKAGPLCGWCTVENKCSRMSKCQNSNEQRRWVDSSDQCITTSVTPDQFVLDTPSIVRTAISSGENVSDNATMKTDEITSQLAREVSKLCQCDNFTIYNEFASLSCYEDIDKTTVTYRGSISDPQLRKHISTWVMNTSEIDILGTTLKVDAECTVEIKKIDDKSCDETSTNTGEQTGNNSAAVAIPIVLILIIAGGIVVAMVTFLFWKRRTGKRFNFFRPWPHSRIGDEEILYDGHDNVSIPEATSGVTLTAVKTEEKEDLSKLPPTNSSQLNYQNPLYYTSEFSSHEDSTTSATQPTSQAPIPSLGQYQPLENVPEKVPPFQNPIYEVTEFPNDNENVPEKVEPSPEDFAPPPYPVEPSTDTTAEKYEPAIPVAIDVETEPQYATVLPKHKRATRKPFAADDDEGSDDDELV